MGNSTSNETLARYANRSKSNQQRFPSLFTFIDMLFRSVILAGPKNRTTRSVEDNLLSPFPNHQFSLRDDNNIHFCSATLVQPLLLLTAAHCILGKSLKGMKAVTGGETLNLIGDPVISLAVNGAEIHPNFDVNTLENDIALLRLHPNVHQVRKDITTASLPPPTWDLPGEPENIDFSITEFNEINGFYFLQKRPFSPAGI